MRQVRQPTSPLVNIVIPVFNLENTIQQCLESIIAQTYPLDCLKVIVVDDDSQDKSVEVIKNFSLTHLYLNLQLVESKTNLGAGGARNTGLEYTEVGYLLFLDGDDFYSENTVESLVNDIESSQADMVLFRDLRFDDFGYYESNPSAKIFEDKSRTIHRYEFSQYPYLTYFLGPCTRLCHVDFFKKYVKSFEENIAFEDMYPMLKSLLQAKTLYINTTATYYYRVGSATQTMSKPMDVKKLRNFINEAEKIALLSQEHPDMAYGIYWMLARSLTRHIDFVARSLRDSKEALQYFNRIRRIVDPIEQDNLYSYDHDDRPLALFTLIKESSSYESFINRFKQFDKKRYKQKKYKQRLDAILTKKDSIVKRLKHPGSSFNEKVVVRAQKKHAVTQFLKRLESVPQRDNVPAVLIGGRLSEARDNDFYLFEYIRKVAPAFPIYYVIKKTSYDYERVKSLGNVVEYGSNEHMMRFVQSKVLLSTHLRGWIEPWPHELHWECSREYTPYQYKKYVWLQHGTIQGKLSCSKENQNANFDKFITSAVPEHQFIIKHFGYGEHEVEMLGLARHDLYSTTKKKKEKSILFMPTWRRELANVTWSSTRTRKDEHFLQSDYFSHILALLHHESLQIALKEAGYRLYFYLHPEFQQYEKYFYKEGGLVEYCDPVKHNLTELLSRADLLITDYSSIHFDFAYQQKPVVYYQFDKATYFSKHSPKGYYMFEKDAFGQVCETADEVYEAVQFAISNELNVEPLYLSRMQRFFPERHNKSREKTFNLIKNLLEECE